MSHFLGKSSKVRNENCVYMAGAIWLTFFKLIRIMFMSISCFITFFKIWPTGGAVLFFYFFCTYFDHVPTTFPPRTFLRLLRYIHWHKKIQACLCFLVHFSMFLACEARALRSLFFFFFFFLCRQSPKFVDFWHFCNLFCLSMIKMQFYISKKFYFYKNLVSYIHTF